jgi:hypothetical protein
VAGLHVVAGDEQAERRRLGHAQAAGHDDALADLLLLHGMQHVPDRLGQRRAGVEEHAHLRQQVAAQHGIGLHGVRHASKPVGTLK